MPPVQPSKKNEAPQPSESKDEKDHDTRCPWCEAPIPGIGADGKISAEEKAAFHLRCFEYFRLVLERCGGPKV